MSIPIDKLYHYIERIACNILQHDDILIYRFYPHGSKKITDLWPLREASVFNKYISVPIYSYDQEPLSYKSYSEVSQHVTPVASELYKKNNLTPIFHNLNVYHNIYDRPLLLISEKQSAEAELYQQNNFILVYYWTHALIARDWYRFCQYEQLEKNVKHTFLIYNRAWSNTREYRLKLADLLIENNLVADCQITLNPIEPELGIHYRDYTFINPNLAPTHVLENYIPDQNYTSSCASADYAIDDYNATDFEVVLETLFDDDRIQLTEKILRPIAQGQPFLLASTCGSLNYLREYGFQTFDSIIDETYDTIMDPVDRLTAMVKTMTDIANWSPTERAEKMIMAQAIADYNKAHFFSQAFFEQVTEELKHNLTTALTELESTNTSAHFLQRRMNVLKHAEIKEHVLSLIPQHETMQVLTKARTYYNQHDFKKYNKY